MHITVNDKVFSSLPADVQKAMVETAEEVVPKACEQIQKAEEETKARLAGAGMTFEALKPDVRAKFGEQMKGVAKAWAEQLDGRGKRGTDALNEYTKLIAATPAK